jgi:DNA modification methylase
MTAYLYTGKCLDYLQTMPSDSIDSVVTDPPYGLKFMNHAWGLRCAYHRDMGRGTESIKAGRLSTSLCWHSNTT